MKIILAVISVVLTSAGCAQYEPKRNASSQEIMQASLLQAERDNTNNRKLHMQPPPDVMAALMPQVVRKTATPNKEPRFDISVNHSSARDFFMGLVEGGKYNMVLHPGVTGDVSLTLREVTIHDVMQTVQSVYGYEYEYHERTRSFHILPIRLQSRIFQIDYLSLTRKGSSGTRVSSGEITQSASIDTSDDGGNTGSIKTITSSEITTSSSVDFWTEITRAMTTIIGTGEGRSVVVNPHTGLLVIRAMPTELREVARFLSLTQKNLSKQVILEAKILEIQLSERFQAGINWSAIAKGGNNKSILAGQTGGGSVFSNSNGFAGSLLGSAIPGFPADTIGNTFSMQPSNDAIALGSSAFGGVFSLALQLNDFVGFIELLESQGDVHVLSSPRIATMNNQKAVIKVGSDEFFITDIETNNNSSSVNSSVSTDVEFTPFFSGIALDVTPQIDDQGMVTMHVHPKISEVTSSLRDIPLATGGTQTVELARSTVRETDTIVRARSGQIIVIGGLMQNRSSDRTAAPPVLGDLPFLGSAFTNKQQLSNKSELVILLRPIVVDSDSVWQESLQRSRGSVRKMKQHSGTENSTSSSVASVIVEGKY